MPKSNLRNFALIALVLIPILLDGMASRLHLDQLRWVYRPLVVFAASLDERALKEQEELLSKDRRGLDERDIKLLQVIGFDSESAGERSRLGISHEPFAVVLVGKDGSVKLRSRKPVSTSQLFRLIDLMPMRKHEMGR